MRSHKGVYPTRQATALVEDGNFFSLVAGADGLIGPTDDGLRVRRSVVSQDDATLDARDGFARWTVSLAAGATRTLTLVYRIEAAAKVVLPAG